MQGPSPFVVAIGLLLGFLLSYVGMWKRMFIFSAAHCDQNGDDCQCVDFQKAIQPTLITLVVSFVLVWAFPNVWQAMQSIDGGGGSYN